MLRLRTTVAIMLSLLVSAGCARHPELSPDEEYKSALQNSRDVVRQYGAVENPDAGRFLRSMASRLVAGLPYPNPRNPQYKVILLNTVEPLAFSPGSGFILISRGLVLSLASEDELAFVIAHEIAHQELAHTAMASPGPIDEKVEYDADKFAAGIMARAGYDPYQALPSIAHAARNREDLRGINEGSVSLERRTAKLREFLSKSSGWVRIGVPLPQREFRRLQGLVR